MAKKNVYLQGEIFPEGGQRVDPRDACKLANQKYPQKYRAEHFPTDSTTSGDDAVLLQQRDVD